VDAAVLGWLLDCSTFDSSAIEMNSVAWGDGRRITRREFFRMAFNLKKVLKALLLSSNQPLAIKDIQAAFARFHEQATLPLISEEPKTEDGVPEAAPAAEGAAEAPASEGLTAAAPEVAEVMSEGPQDPELYVDVPELVTVTQIRETMDQLAVELRAADEGLLLIEGASGYRLVTHPRFARWVRILRQEPPPVRLSQSSVETLAVVAYRQPVTRAEIEQIRGVSAEAGINKLLERELVYIVGRADLPGRPLQYGTTDKFLEFVGIKSCDELPASDVLSSRQIDEWLTNSSTAHKPNDADMGLDEELPLEGAATPPSAQA
jgi:segregation and condensation protein B